jgi:hypothetical protein
MIAYREQLAGALRAIAVTSPTSFTWFGIGSRPLPRAIVVALPPATSRQYLVDALQRELYRSFYTQGRPVPAQPAGSVPAPSDPRFVQALSRANSGSGGWEPGWRIARTDAESVQVQRGGLSVRVRVEDCRAVDDLYEPGMPVCLRRPKDLGAGLPGFYVALGDVALPAGRDGTEVRIYFNVTAAGASRLVAVCTRLLNTARVPFSLKVLDHPTGYDRCDAAVLYLQAGGFDRARESLSAITAACAPHLRRDSPAFTKPLAPGVSVAEHDPGVGTSFGSSRCRLVAEGIVAAHERGHGSLADRIDGVARRFADRGLDLEAPYLAPGSSGRYGI